MNKPPFVTQVINNRYRILYPLGQGGSGITYAALDLQAQQEVALKMLALHHLDNWKQIELFEREGKILQQLNHPAIPEYLDYFQVETETECQFYLVQKLVPGKSLVTLIESGWKPDEATVKDIAQQLLTILIYLQQQIPPVIHRDIKPENIIYCQPEQPNNSQQKGTVYLVDFGSVKDTYNQIISDGTVVGTYGYMAPEQFKGNATINTDLYGLGTTLIFLLTQRHPTELPQKNFKCQYQQYVKISKKFNKWLEKLIEPKRENRLENAQVALEALQGKKALPNQLNLDITREQEELIITFLPSKIYGLTSNIKIYLRLLVDSGFFLALFSLASKIQPQQFSRILTLLLLVYIVGDYLPLQPNNRYIQWISTGLKCIPLIILISYLGIFEAKVWAIGVIWLGIIIILKTTNLKIINEQDKVNLSVSSLLTLLTFPLLLFIALPTKLLIALNLSLILALLLFCLFITQRSLPQLYGKKLLLKIKLFLNKKQIIIKEYLLGKKLRQYIFSVNDHTIKFFPKSERIQILDKNKLCQYSLFVPKNELIRVQTEIENQ